MKKGLDFIAGTEEQTIANRIVIINTYNVSKVAKQVPYPLSFDRFDDQILPLTKNAIADFKRLVSTNNANLPKRIAELRSHIWIQNFDTLPHNPNGEFVFKVDGKVKKLSRREWWTIGTANALTLMLYQVAGYITKIESNTKLATPERQAVFENWNFAKQWANWHLPASINNAPPHWSATLFTGNGCTIITNCPKLWTEYFYLGTLPAKSVQIMLFQHVAL